ncbi:NADH-quinone oxidoreductase subunit A [bacterium]|nr:NADH-quinone oxidoreductase subunit A [bacterium]
MTHDTPPVYENYFPILALMIIATIIPLAILVITHILGPRKPSERKLSVYESGMPPVGDAHPKFSIKFYIIGMLFILFDIEIVFMYPWAVIYKKWVSTSSFILIEGLVFIAILLVGYAYAWKKGALEWE